MDEHSTQTIVGTPAPAVPAAPFDWGLAVGCAALVLGLLGIGVAIKAMASPSRTELMAARGFFVMAAILALASFILMTYEQPMGSQKLIVAGFVGAVCAVALTIGMEWTKTKQPEKQQPFEYCYVYAVADPQNGKRATLYAAIENKGPTRLYNVGLNFTAITTDRPRKGAGPLTIPMLDGGLAIETKFELEAGEYGIEIHLDDRMLLESLIIEGTAEEVTRQKIRVVDADRKILFTDIKEF